MHPAKSVIFFTTASGAGYGLMIWLALLAARGELWIRTFSGIVIFGLALGLIAGGLMSSTLHLGHPERAWRAMSQWRSSWLSREGLAALVAFIPLGLFAMTCVFDLATPAVSVSLGAVGAVISLAVLCCTAMIYASLRPIPAWHNGWTVAGYFALGPMNGAVILVFLLLSIGQPKPAMSMIFVAIPLLAIGLAIKLFYWRHVRSASPASSAGSATGLAHLGKVELSASPHDQDNYLLREMGFRIARKHAAKLRLIAIIFGFAVPMLLLAGLLLTVFGIVAVVLSALALVSCQIGLLVERWLFFAEAKHVVTLYYGEQAV